jgi:hypothetical protein
MSKIIDEKGNLNIEDLLLNNLSLNAIIEDGVVTEEEKAIQLEKVISIIKKIEEECSEHEIKLVRDLLAEFSALLFINQITQDINND